MENKYLHEVVMTAIVIKDGKYLITRRSAGKKRFPSMWTVPGGKLETDDYINLPKDTKDYWYNVLEQVLKREVREEVGLEITNYRVRYKSCNGTRRWCTFPRDIVHGRLCFWRSEATGK